MCTSLSRTRKLGQEACKGYVLAMWLLGEELPDEFEVDGEVDAPGSVEAAL
jgi:hypothetical protein